MNDRKPAVKSAVLVVLGACLVLWLSGCASDKHDSAESSPAATSSDPALVAEIRQAAEATKALTSVHLAVRSTGDPDSMLGISSADVDVRANPFAVKGLCTYQGQAGVPFRIKDDVIGVKMFDDWTTLGTVSDLAASRVVDPTNGMAKILSGITNLQRQGSEVIDGIPTTRITGIIPPETVKILDPGLRKSSPATAWIAEDGSHRLVQARMELGPGQSVDVKLSKWNEPVNID
jgi:uncharacterized lipoprotein YbaY